MVRATNFILTLGRAENKYKKQSKLMVAQRLNEKWNHTGSTRNFFYQLSKLWFLDLIIASEFFYFIKEVLDPLELIKVFISFHNSKG